jgi:hypothetical protein
LRVGSPRLEDRLGKLEPPYRSRGEAQVGRLLDRYGIPFFYEQPTIVYDRGRNRIWRPDFTLPHQDNLIVEYAGMPEIPAYAAGVQHKIAAYQANGMKAVFVYPQDLTGPNWPERVIKKIYGVRGPSSSQYGASRRGVSAYRRSGYVQPGH